MPNNQPKTVLIVDDEPVVLTLLVALVRSKGFNVLQAWNGPKAIDIAHESPYLIDLLITDVVMHPMNGIELAKAIRKLQPKIPVLYLSGYSPPTEVISSEAVKGEAEFMRKPFHNSALLEKVESIIGQVER